MMRNKWIAGAITVVFVVFIVAACLIYMRPQTVEQRYPLLNMSDCTEIKGYYFVSPEDEKIQYHIDPDDSRFSELIQLLQSVETRKRLSNILPRGTKTHRLSDGDFKWELMLNFDDVAFPSGEHSSGYMLEFRNFFGDFSISFDGEEVWYSISNQEQWLKEIMEIISRE